MRAMVLAAGYGTRLRPATDSLPKALIPVGGRPMIEYSLRLLKCYGIREIVINLHHLGEKIADQLGDGKKLGLEIVYSREKELLDTGGGILQARSLLDNGTFIVINSDILIDLPLKDVVSYHREKMAIATLVLRPDALADRYGAIETAAEGRIHRFLNFELPGEVPTPLTKQMFTGVQVLEPGIFEYMESKGPFSTTGKTYPKLLLQGEALYGFPFHGFWQDLGTMERIEEAEEKLATGEVRLHYLKN